MTPKERAEVFIEKHREQIWTRDRLAKWFSDEMVADRQALQSEIVKSLQLERTEASPNAWLALNAAIGIVQSIFAQQSQPEEKEANAKIKTVPVVAHENLEAYSYYVEKVNDWQSSRIATLHEWQAKDAQTIQQLNQSNNALSLKVAQLEKEKNELT